MVTQYDYEIKQAVKEVYKHLCKEYHSPELQAGFAIFAQHMEDAATRITAHTPVTKKVDPNYKMPKRFNKGQYIGPYKEKKK